MDGLNDGSHCTWFCTREEPIVYINEKPYVLREQDFPLKNITTCMGINADRLEQLEHRLKLEVIKEARKNHNLILIHDELVDGRILPYWVVADRVQTPREVFEGFSDSGYRVSFNRYIIRIF
jgi:hypothetical protein